MNLCCTFIFNHRRDLVEECETRIILRVMGVVMKKLMRKMKLKWFPKWTGRVWKNQAIELSPSFGLACKVYQKGDGGWMLNLHPFWGNIFLRLPIKTKRIKAEHGMAYSLGFSFFWEGRSLHLDFGKFTKLWELPFFHLEYMGTSVYTKENEWVRTDTGLPSEGVTFSDRCRLEDEIRSKLDIFYYAVDRLIVNKETTKAVIEVKKQHYFRKWFPFLKKDIYRWDVDFTPSIGIKGCSSTSFDVKKPFAFWENIEKMKRDKY